MNAGDGGAGGDISGASGTISGLDWEYFCLLYSQCLIIQLHLSC